MNTQNKKVNFQYANKSILMTDLDIIHCFAKICFFLCIQILVGEATNEVRGIWIRHSK